MEQEKQPLKVYYSIGEVADMFGVNTSLIRFWEKEFDVIKPHKNKKGNRQFIPSSGFSVVSSFFSVRFSIIWSKKKA